MKVINKIQRFMYGRYGADELYSFLFKLYFFLLIIDLYINSYILLFIELFVVVTIIYRFFSKNINKRREENRQFLRFSNKITKPIKTKFKHIFDKNNIYKKCHKCGTTIRLPLSSSYGIKYVKCPRCKTKLVVFSLKKAKVEVIKKN